MSDEVKHECAVAMVVLRRPPSAIGDFGGTKLSLLLEKQHNRGQDGAGAAILHARPVPGEEPYWIAKSASATPLVDVLGAIAKRPYISHRGAETQRDEISTRFKESQNPDNPAGKLCASVPLCEKIFLGHLRYATFGKNEVAFCHPFIHEASELEHTLLLAGNFNLTNAHELFDDYSRHGSFPTSRADSYLICELIAHELASDSSRVEHVNNLPRALSAALANADGAWTFCGATGDGWAFATRDPHGIRPGFYYISDDVVAVASERPAIQAAFDVPPEAVKELPPGKALVVSPTGETTFESLNVSKFESLNSKGGFLAALHFKQTIAGGSGTLLARLVGVETPVISILGCGVSGLGCADLAAAFGNEVRILDINMKAMEAAKNTLPANVSFLISNRSNLEKCLRDSDVFFNCILWPKDRKDHIVYREDLRLMKPGALLVDVACDDNGAVETCRSTTHDDPVYVEEGVTHYCVDNIPSAFARSDSILLATATLPYLLAIAGKGPLQAIRDDRHLRDGLTCMDGKLTLKETALKQNRPWTDAETLL